MAGVLPYLGTSVSTIYCAWEITHAHNTGSGFLMSEQTAEAALHVLEPLQVGYGAVVSYALQFLFLISLLTSFADHLLPRRYSLGSGVRWLRWTPRLQALCYRCLDPRSRMAHYLPPG